MSTLIFYLNDPVIQPDEKIRLLQISRDIWRRRDGQTERPIADPRALEAQHHRVDRGDL